MTIELKKKKKNLNLDYVKINSYKCTDLSVFKSKETITKKKEIIVIFKTMGILCIQTNNNMIMKFNKDIDTNFTKMKYFYWQE